MKSRFRNPYLLLIILAVIWGSSFILMKEGLKAFTSNQVAALRIFIAGLALFPFIKWRRLNIKKSDWIFFFLAGVLGNGIPAFLFTAAQLHISSSLSGALNGLTPLFALIVGVSFLGVKFSAKKLAGVLVGFIGALFLVFNNGFDVSALGDIKYSLLLVLATLFYGINVNLIKHKLGTYPPFVAAALPLGLIFVIAGGLLIYFNFSIDFMDSAQVRPFIAVVMLAVFGTAISLILFNDLIQQTNAVFASSVTYLIPIVALFWGIVDNEVITAFHVVGLSLILVAIWLMRSKN